MKKVLSIMSLLFCMSCTVLDPKITAITENDIREFYAHIQTEVKRENAQVFSEIITPTCRVVTTDETGMKYEAEASAERYVQDVDAFYRSIKILNYKIDIVSFVISKDKQTAKVYIKTYQLFLRDGKRVENSSDAWQQISIIDGKMQINSIKINY